MNRTKSKFLQSEKLEKINCREMRKSSDIKDEVKKSNLQRKCQKKKKKKIPKRNNKLIGFLAFGLTGDER